MHKLTVVTDAAGALEIEHRLAAAEHALPLAVSRFEHGKVDWSIEAYFEVVPEATFVDGLLAGVGGIRDVRREEIADTDWVRQVEAMLSPVAAGGFLVHGPHDRAKAAGDPHAIEIEAGEAFGTAHHASTQGCLMAIGGLLRTGLLPWGEGSSPRCVLDLGTGSGVLAIAVAQLAPEATILATDIDPRSVEIARANADLNRVGAQVETMTANGLDHPRLQPPAVFDLIVANILADPLISLAPQMARTLAPQGRIILSGLLNEQADAVLAAYRAAGCHESDRIVIGEWTTLTLASAGDLP